VLLDAAAVHATTLGLDLLVEADDDAAEMVKALGARRATIVSEVHVVAEARPPFPFHPSVMP
jgi:hypothetical protein